MLHGGISAKVITHCVHSVLNNVYWLFLVEHDDLWLKAIERLEVLSAAYRFIAFFVEDTKVLSS